MCECHNSKSRAQVHDEMIAVLQNIARDSSIDADTRVKAATAVLYELKPKTQYTSYGSTIPIPLAVQTWTSGGTFASSSPEINKEWLDGPHVSMFVDNTDPKSEGL